MVLATSLLSLLIILGFVAGLSDRLTAEPDSVPKVHELRERRPPSESSPPPSPDPEHESQPVPPTGDDGLLEVLFFDVGQADATLLRHDEVTMLIDTGRWRRDDVVASLERVGVTELDLVVVTHPHADHLGQFDLIMDRFDVAEVWWSGSVTTSDTFQRSLTALENSEAAYEEPRSGDRTMVGPLGVEVLNPPVGVDLTDLHDAGIALRVTYGSIRFAFTGDAEAHTERRMVEAHGQDLAAEVLKLGHHGSGTSTHPSFLAAVAPGVAIVSAGADNPYGHPDAEVLARLEAAGVDVYKTASQGTIRVATDGTTVEVSTDKD